MGWAKNAWVEAVRGQRDSDDVTHHAAQDGLLAVGGYLNGGCGLVPRLAVHLHRQRPLRDQLRVSGHRARAWTIWRRTWAIMPWECSKRIQPEWKSPVRYGGLTDAGHP